MKNRKNLVVIGYDQGIANAGLCVMEYNYQTRKRKVLFKEHITTSPKEDKCKRILIHYEVLQKNIKKYNVKGIACERLMFNPKSKSSTRRKSVSMMTVNEISAVVMLLAAQNKLEFREFMPMTVKKQFANNGTATKDDMIKEAMKKFRLKKKPIEHIADAMAIASVLIDELIN